MQQSPIVESILTCPGCGFASVEVMPIDACIIFHECASCHTRLRPKSGDCCVFCSYGSVKCPPMQQSLVCCGPLPHRDSEARLQCDPALPPDLSLNPDASSAG